MTSRRWGWAVIVAVVLWGVGAGLAEARPQPAGRTTVYLAAVARPTTLPCPIAVPGGVICHGPAFPEYPPKPAVAGTLYLPFVAW